MPGHEIVGRVIEVGSEVKRPKDGDAVSTLRPVRQWRGAALSRKRDTDLLSETPIVARLMEIGMADATIEDFHDDVVWA